MKELTREEIDKYTDFLTVGDLKEFLYKHNLPNNAKVLIQRVEDIYYEKHNWGSYLKEGEHSYYARKHNEDIESGKYLDKEEYPNIKPENLIPYTEEEIKKSMEQYHPAWCCVRYKDDQDLLFIDLHY